MINKYRTLNIFEYIIYYLHISILEIMDGTLDVKVSSGNPHLEVRILTNIL